MTKPMRTSVLIAGGGVAALEAALALRELAPGLVDVELVAPEPAFWYRPVAVAEPFGLGEVRHFDLADLASAAGTLFTLAAVDAVDIDAREVRLSTGAVTPYDVLLLACGGVPTPAVPGALTFRGPADGDAFGRLLAELESGLVHRLVFVVPWGTTWVLPGYELALLTSLWAERHGLDDVELSLVTPEDGPLELFGPAASQAIRELLDERGVTLHTHASAIELRDGALRLLPDGELPAERVVALPQIRGQRIEGLAQTLDGFISTDAHGLVLGLEDVYAAGDITAFPVKQGGLAAQQAEAAAEAIASRAGAELTPRAFEPILRGLLLTGSHPRYLRRDLATGEAPTWVSETPIWWPPTKLVGRRLSPLLAERVFRGDDERLVRHQLAHTRGVVVRRGPAEQRVEVRRCEPADLLGAERDLDVEPRRRFLGEDVRAGELGEERAESPPHELRRRPPDRGLAHPGRCLARSKVAA